jgi:hypothetical protein
MAISGFRHAGIWLLEADFLPAATRDVTFHTAPSEKPSTCTFSEGTEVFFCMPTTEEPPTSSFLCQSPTEIIPIPKVGQDNKRMT